MNKLNVLPNEETASVVIFKVGNENSDLKKKKKRFKKCISKQKKHFQTC